jgi:hypothetical protein
MGLDLKDYAKIRLNAFKSLKIGDEVLVAFDEKVCRATIGTIVNRKDKSLLVRFSPWNCEEEIKPDVEIWFDDKSDNSYSTFIKGEDLNWRGGGAYYKLWTPKEIGEDHEHYFNLARKYNNNG